MAIGGDRKKESWKVLYQKAVKLELVYSITGLQIFYI